MLILYDKDISKNNMKTIAIIIAGGSGHRMGQDIPKQFINVYDKPIIIYTLESFQRHPMVDAIEVVCLSVIDAAYCFTCWALRNTKKYYLK